MMTGPGDERALEGRGRLRAAHTDREQAIEVLKTAFVQGRLTKDELDVRVGEALASRTYAELAAVTADIPAGLIGQQPPREPARSRPPMSDAAKAAMSVAVAIVVSAVLMLATGLPLYGMFIPLYFMVLLAGGVQMIASRYEQHKRHERHEKHSRGQLPPRPGPGGQAPVRHRPGHDPALPGTRPNQTRTDLRTHSPRTHSPRTHSPRTQNSRTQNSRTQASRVQAIAWGSSATSALVALVAVDAVITGHVERFILLMLVLIMPMAVTWGAVIEARQPTSQGSGELPH